MFWNASPFYISFFSLLIVCLCVCFMFTCYIVFLGTYILCGIPHVGYLWYPTNVVSSLYCKYGIPHMYPLDTYFSFLSAGEEVRRRRGNGARNWVVNSTIDHIRRLGIVRDLACNGGLCGGGIIKKILISLHLKGLPAWASVASWFQSHTGNAIITTKAGNSTTTKKENWPY